MAVKHDSNLKHLIGKLFRPVLTCIAIQFMPSVYC